MAMWIRLTPAFAPSAVSPMETCEDVIYGTSIVYLATCTIVGTTNTIGSTANGSTLLVIIFCALTSMLSYFFFTREPKVPPSSIMFFLLKALFKKSTTTFFLFFSVVCIFSLVLKTLVGGFCGFSFSCTNKYRKIFVNTKVE